MPIHVLRIVIIPWPVSLFSVSRQLIFILFCFSCAAGIWASFSLSSPAHILYSFTFAHSAFLFFFVILYTAHTHIHY